MLFLADHILTVLALAVFTALEASLVALAVFFEAA